MKTIDYPAGHSMDSEWFAVDKEGNVGFFDTGQDGMVPVIHGREYFISEYIHDHTTPISKNLNRIFLCEEKVNEIIGKCSKKNIQKLLTDFEKDKWLYFEGVIILKKGCKWEDLDFHNTLEKSDEDFALCISPEKRLYYIISCYNLEKKFIRALKKGLIIKGFHAASLLPEDYENNGGSDINAFGGYIYENEWGNEPYVRKYIPPIPLKINAFSTEAQKKALCFNNISFEDALYIQPIEFTSCESYGGWEDIIERSGARYVNVTLSDNDTKAFCLLSKKELIEDEINIYRCSICNIKKHDKYQIKSFQDDPRVILLDYVMNKSNYYYILDKNLNPLLDLFNTNNIQLSKEDLYYTAAVKCIPREKESLEQLLHRCFYHCYRKLEKEIEMLHPLLVLCTGKVNFELLKSKYVLDIDHFEIGKLGNITIKTISIPILLIGNINHANILSKKLKPISSQINQILNTKRDLPQHPRVIK